MGGDKGEIRTLDIVPLKKLILGNDSLGCEVGQKNAQLLKIIRGNPEISRHKNSGLGWMREGAGGPLGSSIQAMASVMAVKIQLSSPIGVFRSWRPRGRRANGNALGVGAKQTPLSPDRM